jgi:hypothetical protein
MAAGPDRGFHSWQQRSDGVLDATITVASAIRS